MFYHTYVGARFWEIDVARGIAVVLMIFFHGMWDLAFFGLSTVNVFSSPWQVFARSIGSLFLMLMGISLTLGATRMSGSTSLWWYALRRGGSIIILGLVISLGTYLAFGDTYVRFGILHLLGVMLILAVPFVYTPLWIPLAIGLAMIILGFVFGSTPGSMPWLLWLGIPATTTVMVDYYPLLPWGGATLIGVVLGRVCYPNGMRRFPIHSAGTSPIVQALRLLGRHSLMIYLVHQPLLFGLIFALQALFR